MIGVDWGTTSFRAFRMARDGTIRDRRSGPRGILNVPDNRFADTLREEIGPWLATGEDHVLLSGMIGSRQGWAEAAYLHCPAAVSDLAASLLRIPEIARQVLIVPGVDDHHAHMPDVMRGEEVQIFGGLLWLGARGGTFVLPGTHSKWAHVDDGRIRSFRTYMTGEIYAACRKGTILGRLMTEDGGDPEAFAVGVRDGSRSGGPGALLHRLFGVRTAGLFGRLEPAGLADYLSGLLIGAEISEAGNGGEGTVWLIGAEALTARYQAAARELGIDARAVEPDSIARGYAAIARSAGLIEAA